MSCQGTDAVKDYAHAEGNQHHRKNLGRIVSRNLYDLAVAYRGQGNHRHVNTIQKFGLAIKNNIIAGAAGHNDQEN